MYDDAQSAPICEATHDAAAPLGASAVENQVDPSQVAAVARLTHAIFEHTGYDFRDYAPASLLRRIRRGMSEEHVTNVHHLRELVCANQSSMERLLDLLTLPVTAMFRDPGFYRVFRHVVGPTLATYPYLRLWVAGCSTGQEAYSLAIVLHELGLYERCRIYATDLHAGRLDQAQAGIYPLSVMREYSRNYLEAGGANSLADYFIADSKNAILRPSLRANILFANHNLASDGSFNEFHVIFCRNVMIYFNDRLQRRVHGLIYDSLGRLGFLALGRSESIRFSPHEASYQTLVGSERIYRKIA